MKNRVAQSCLIIAFFTVFSAPLQAKATSVDPEESGHIETIDGSVARATFTRAVVKREPVDSVEQLTTNEHHLYYFTELKGMAGQAITHRWLYDGTIKAEVEFSVGAPRWRVWSSKTLMSDWTGTWTVEVLNGLGQVIYRESFEYVTVDTEIKQ